MASLVSKLKIATLSPARMVAVAFPLIPTVMELWILSVSALAITLEVCAKHPSLAICHARMEPRAVPKCRGGSMERTKPFPSTFSCASWKDVLNVTGTIANVQRMVTFLGTSASFPVTWSAKTVPLVRFEVATKSAVVLATFLATAVKRNARLAV